MILLLTLAGRDQYAEGPGYHVPKYLLPWGDRSVLATILDELRAGGAFSDVFLVANRRDDDYAPHVRAILRARGVPEDRLVFTADTPGQAATALVGLDAVDAVRGGTDEPVVINSADTILYRRDGGAIAAALREADGYVDVFGSSNRYYSYVLLDEARRVKEITEKIVVSDTATSGCYGFRDAATYRAFYMPGPDRYVSEVFKRMIAAGRTVVAGPRHTEADTVVLHSAEEYLNAATVRL